MSKLSLVLEIVSISVILPFAAFLVLALAADHDGAIQGIQQVLLNN